MPNEFCLVFELYTIELHDISSRVYILSLNSTEMRFIHVVTYSKFIHTVTCHSFVQMYHNLFIHSIVDRHVACFQVLPIIAAINSLDVFW